MTDENKEIVTETVEETTTKKPRATKKTDVVADGKATQTAFSDEFMNKLLKDITILQSQVATIGIPAEVELKFFKLNSHTQLPSFGTEASACFDIRVNLKGELDNGVQLVDVMTKTNQPIQRRIQTEGDETFVELAPHERMIAPTGMIVDIPENYSLRVHPRSGTSYKQAINLINQEGVIDSDYVEELKLLIENTSDTYVKIKHNERYAQADLQFKVPTKIVEITERPQQKTDRTGGLGHTGTK